MFLKISLMAEDERYKLSKIFFFVKRDGILNVVSHRYVEFKFRKQHYISSSIHLAK